MYLGFSRQSPLMISDICHDYGIGKKHPLLASPCSILPTFVRQMFAKCSIIHVFISLKKSQGLFTAFSKLKFRSLAFENLQGLPVTYLLCCIFLCSLTKTYISGSQCHNGPVGEIIIRDLVILRNTTSCLKSGIIGV